MVVLARGDIRAQEGHGRKCRRVVRIVAGPSPNTRAGGAVANGRINVGPLPLRLFAGDDHVDVKVRNGTTPPVHRSRGGRGLQEALMISPVSGSASRA